VCERGTVTPDYRALQGITGDEQTVKFLSPSPVLSREN